MATGGWSRQGAGNVYRQQWMWVPDNPESSVRRVQRRLDRIHKQKMADMEEKLASAYAKYRETVFTKGAE